MLAKIFTTIADKIRPVQAGQALRDAARDGNLISLQKAQARGGDLHAEDENGLTPLCLAAAGGHAAVINYLLDQGVDIDGGPMAAGKGPALMQAIAQGHNDCALLLLDRGARMDVTDYEQRSPLHLAIYLQNDTMADALLQRGADVNTEARSGNTPLHEAITNAQEKLAIQLVRAQAQYAAKDRYGAPAEDRAIAKEMKDLRAAIDDEKLRPQREAEARLRAAEEYAAALAQAATLQQDTAVLPRLRVKRRGPSGGA